MYKTQKIFILMLLVLTPMIPIIKADYQEAYFEIAKGNVPGHSFIAIEGIDENIGTTEYVLWAEGTAFIFPAGPTSMNVSSTSAQDNPAGTGAFNVTIFGLDVNYIEIIETVTLNGTSPVETVNQFYRINRMRIGRVGTATFNVGEIYIGTGATVDGEPAVIYNEIVEERGVSSSATYTVPDGYTAFLAYFAFGTDTTKIIEVTLRRRCVDCPDNAWVVDYHTHFSLSSLIHDTPLPLPYPEHTDIKVQGRNTVGSAFASLDAFFILVEDGYTLINQSYTGSAINVTLSGDIETTTGANNNTLLFLLIVTVVIALVGSSKRR